MPLQSTRPPWKPWGMSEGIQTRVRNGARVLRHDARNILNPNIDDQPLKSSFYQSQRHATFDNFSHVPPQILLKQQEDKHLEDKSKSRNLEVSKQLLSHFKAKPLSTVIPGKKFLSETHSAFRIPGKEKPIPIRHSGYKTIINMAKTDDNSVLYEKDPDRRGGVMHALDSDAIAKIHDLKSQIMAGRYVSMTDITTLKMKLGNSQEGFIKTTDIPSQGISQNTEQHRKSRRAVARKSIFCEKGIVNIPTPHTTHSGMNTFGTPADLRISLSNSNTPEFNGRRRFYFDFTGFLDSEIQLYLEGSRRLVIRAERPERFDKGALKVTDFIDLPKDLPVDNLRIVRDLFGTLIVEEAWKFL